MKFLLWMTVPLCKTCKTCIHYSPPLDGRFESSRAVCKLESSNVITGEYSLAQDIRETTCRGKLYVPEPDLKVKRWKHHLKFTGVCIGYVLLYASLFAYARL